MCITEDILAGAMEDNGRIRSHMASISPTYNIAYTMDWCLGAQPKPHLQGDESHIDLELWGTIVYTHTFVYNGETTQYTVSPIFWEAVEHTRTLS